MKFIGSPILAVGILLTVLVGFILLWRWYSHERQIHSAQTGHHPPKTKTKATGPEPGKQKPVKPAKSGSSEIASVWNWFTKNFTNIFKTLLLIFAAIILVHACKSVTNWMDRGLAPVNPRPAIVVPVAPEANVPAAPVAVPPPPEPPTCNTEPVVVQITDHPEGTTVPDGCVPDRKKFTPESLGVVPVCQDLSTAEWHDWTRADLHTCRFFGYRKSDSNTSVEPVVVGISFIAP
ncbi:MAG: hypothetical protein AB203_00065 [Parcubacteria bacterium C7867-008]|nr:MAG: hypothetical protein AB203_00065 [Parcubacteria bacterium C7867-008]